MQHKVEICGVNTAKLKVLKNEETQALLLRAKAGDAQARDELIAGNLRLVLSVIQRFANRGENLDDLFQVGCIGLIKAIDNFNTDLDVRFSTYGVPMILGEVRRYLRDNSALRVSRAMRDTAYKVLQAKDAFMGTLGVPCSGCRYCCDTCPAGLNIPLLIQGYNEQRVSGEGWRLSNLKWTKGPEECLHCNTCRQYCPQRIDIPEVLAQYAALRAAL